MFFYASHFMNQEEFDFLVQELDANYGELREQEENIKEKRDKIMSELDKWVTPYGSCQFAYKIMQIPHEGGYFYTFTVQYKRPAPKQLVKSATDIVEVHNRLIGPLEEHVKCINSSYELLLANLTFTQLDNNQIIPIADVEYLVGYDGKRSTVNLLGPKSLEYANQYRCDFTFPEVNNIKHMIDRLVKDKLTEICTKNFKEKKIYAEFT